MVIRPVNPLRQETVTQERERTGFSELRKRIFLELLLRDQLDKE